MKLVRKLNASTMGFGRGIIKKLVAAVNPNEGDKNAVALFTVAGIARVVDRGDGQYGSWVRFSGEFAGQRTANPDGESYRSPQMFIPRPFEGILENAVLESIQKDPNKIGGVEFAVQVSAQPSDVGDYEFVMKPLVKFQPSDTLRQLLDSAGMLDDEKKPAAKKK